MRCNRRDLLELYTSVRPATGQPVIFYEQDQGSINRRNIAINGYAQHIANSEMQEVNKVWQHIMEDEKQHYGMFLTLLRKYDQEEYHGYMLHNKDTLQKEKLQGYQPDYNKQLILNNIREDIKGEFEAVVLYEQLLMEAPYQDVKDVFLQIIPMEKEHAEHLTQVLLFFDKDKYNGLT
jgi:rubrerythrin